MEKISSWGRLSAEKHQSIYLTDRDSVLAQIQSSGVGISYGAGRSYGDVCLNPGGVIWRTNNLDHFIRFDSSTGRLICESGLRLQEIQDLFVPLGWMLAVTPGTELITVGGAIANDIHGKNHHHCGTFGEWVHKICLQRTDGELIECTPESNSDWFAATVGGIGLTGVIVWAELQLVEIPSAFLHVENIVQANLKTFFELSQNSQNEWQHCVSWIDCTQNRQKDLTGIFSRANFAHGEYPLKVQKHNLTFPVTPPISLINAYSMKCFNLLYLWMKQQGKKQTTEHYKTFLYPLDAIQNWNKAYGAKGFYQYQCVLPGDAAAIALTEMLEQIRKANDGSILTVLKSFSERPSVGMLSFPTAGITLAIDFPNRGQRTMKLFDSLDAIVRNAKGRLYLAKDARMPRDLFESSYPRLNEFLPYRDHGISSALSRRLMGY
ncbi:FAD-binding oxidoreductase [Undibacterium flavidum]|uniref:FAD-binding oxidoreductase n=1 Tax=Undibacterium flavidum TaxID=2762297 RepID=A0ABR6Y959_9BURK|nr:FAD-binding oxidoreductase [Undibacterium flavidum]MBC3873153.1 FAD-binding oxidoreductase [Undibacterium flavidum]